MDEGLASLSKDLCFMFLNQLGLDQQFVKYFRLPIDGWRMDDG
jgi:hypothetical protein